MLSLKESSALLDWDVGRLSDEALVALLIGSPQAAPRLLELAGGLDGLPQLTTPQLLTLPGVGRAAASRLRAAIELNRRIALHRTVRPLISCPADVAALLLPEMGQLDQEHLKVVLLSTRNQVLRIETVLIGSVNSAAVRIAEVFKPAIRINAPAILVAHNHPSGDVTPSPEDVAVTRQLVEAGRLLDVEVLDHLIIGRGQWLSLRERRLGFSA